MKLMGEFVQYFGHWLGNRCPYNSPLSSSMVLGQEVGLLKMVQSILQLEGRPGLH